MVLVITHSEQHFSTDPIIQQQSKNRLYCIRQLQLEKLKKIFYLVLLPIILIILSILTLKFFNINTLIFIPFFIAWIFCGSFYSFILNITKWGPKHMYFNTSNNINPNNCGI